MVNRTGTDINMNTGTFYGVGVGPGDPELITLKARRILSEVPIIFVPKKDKESASYARSIINGFINNGQEVIELVFPMSRDREQLVVHWQQAVDVIWSYLERGRDCAFINLGDPLLYGSFIHIMDRLLEKYPKLEVKVVPGTSSISAAAANALVPLATDEDRVAIISGKFEENFIKYTLQNFETVVFLKINNVFNRLIDILEELDLINKCVYVKKCTTKDEEIVKDISKLKGEKLDYFSLLIVRR